MGGKEKQLHTLGGGGRAVPAAPYSEPLFRVQLQQHIIDAEC